MPSPNSLRNALIRVYSTDLRKNLGNVVVAEVLFRRVNFRSGMAPDGRGQTIDVPGAVLIDADTALGKLSTIVRTGTHITVVIKQTDELLWLPVTADLNQTGYWAIEMVPLVDYARAALKPDEDIIREAHQRS